VNRVSPHSQLPRASFPDTLVVCGGSWHGNPPSCFFRLGCSGGRVPDTGYLDAGSWQRQVPLLLFSEGTIFKAHTR